MEKALEMTSLFTRRLPVLNDDIDKAVLSEYLYAIMPREIAAEALKSVTSPAISITTLVGRGDSATDEFNTTPTSVNLRKRIVKGSLRVVSGAVDVTDNENGNIEGSGVDDGDSTIDYDTGAFNIKFDSPPARADGTIEFTDNPTDDDTITVGNRTYTFKDTLSTGPTVPNEIKIETGVEDTAQNVVYVIMGTGTEGTHWSEGTEAHSQVNATRSVATITFEANDDYLGTLGNDIVLAASNSSDTTLSGDSLSGGVDVVVSYDFNGECTDRLVNFEDKLRNGDYGNFREELIESYVYRALRAILTSRSRGDQVAEYYNR